MKRKQKRSEIEGGVSAASLVVTSAAEYPHASAMKRKQKRSETNGDVSAESIVVASTGAGIFTASLLAVVVPSSASATWALLISLAAAAATAVWGIRRHGWTIHAAGGGYLSHINWISGAFFIAALGLFSWRRCRGKSAEELQKELYALMVASGSAAQMPIGIALFIGAFDLRLLAHMEGVTVPLLFAGATVLFIGAIGIVKAW